MRHFPLFLLILTLFAVPLHSYAALTDNLVSYWKLDGNSNDAVGSNNGSNTSITFSTGNGKIGQGAGFNGTSSYIDVGTDTSLKLTGPVSVALWAYPTATPTSFYRLFQKSTDVNDNEAYYIGPETANSLVQNFCIYNIVTSTNRCANSGVSLPLNTWTFIVGTYDGSSMKIYLNGTLVATNATGSFTNQYRTGDFHALIGRGKVITGRYWSGNIDAVGVWSRGLSAAEVSQLYNCGRGIQHPFSPGCLSFSPWQFFPF